jgi:deoxyribonuclease IV
MGIIFGPAGLGPVKTAAKILESYHKQGLKACEIAFTYSVYIKPEETKVIREAAEKFGISLSIHAPYFVNLNSKEKIKREASKDRILKCAEVGEMLGAKTVVFHPGYYGDDRTAAFAVIKEQIMDMLAVVKKKGWKIQLAPEIMGKVNVFGSLDEVSRLAKETGCFFCIDFAHLLARDKKIDYSAVEKAFPQKKWHCHFSGIVYGEKGEKHHKTTETGEWKQLLTNLPKDREIVLINESPTLVDDSIEGLKLYADLR